jgi:hypothetical protein
MSLDTVASNTVEGFRLNNPNSANKFRVIIAVGYSESKRYILRDFIQL